MTEPVQLRLADSSDVPAMVAMAQCSPLAPQWTAEQYRNMLAKQDQALRRVFWLAERGELPVGFATVSALCVGTPAEAELESVVVVESYRRCGIGRSLLQKTIAWAAEQGADRLRLEVRCGNRDAVSLYRALGFQTKGLRRAYYTGPVEDALCLQLAL